MIKTISIPEVRRDGGTQPRGMLDMVVVQNYTDALVEEGASFPPVTIFYDGSTYWLADGFHRTAAYEQAGKEAIHAEIHQGSQRDAVLYSLGANNAHGLQRSNADKQRAIRRLLLDPEWTAWSDRRIGQVVRCSHKTVGAARHRLQQSGEIPTINTRKTAGGRVIDTSAIGTNQKEEKKPITQPKLIEESTGELPSQPEADDELVPLILVEDETPVDEELIRKELKRHIDPDGRFIFRGATTDFLRGVAEEFGASYQAVSQIWFNIRFGDIGDIGGTHQPASPPTHQPASPPTHQPKINLLDTVGSDFDSEGGLGEEELGEEKIVAFVGLGEEEPKQKINLLDALGIAKPKALNTDLKVTIRLTSRNAGPDAIAMISLGEDGIGKAPFIFKKTTVSSLFSVLLTTLKPYLPEEE